MSRRWTWGWIGRWVGRWFGQWTWRWVDDEFEDGLDADVDAELDTELDTELGAEVDAELVWRFESCVRGREPVLSAQVFCHAFPIVISIFIASANLQISTENFMWVLLHAVKKPLQVNPSLQSLIQVLWISHINCKSIGEDFVLLIINENFSWLICMQPNGTICQILNNQSQPVLTTNRLTTNPGGNLS